MIEEAIEECTGQRIPAILPLGLWELAEGLDGRSQVIFARARPTYAVQRMNGVSTLSYNGGCGVWLVGSVGG